MQKLVYMYADESCLGIQYTDRDSPGGAAGLIEYWHVDHWVRRDYWVSEPATTNNRMALRSGIEGLRRLRRRCRVVFTSDSQYLIRGMREWVHDWSHRGWRRKSGAVENAELWKELVAEAARHLIDWRWVRGHADHPQNEYANMLAVRAARTQDATAGLVESGFAEWIASQQSDHARFRDYVASAPPLVDEFQPGRPVDILSCRTPGCSKPPGTTPSLPGGSIPLAGMFLLFRISPRAATRHTPLPSSSGL